MRPSLPPDAPTLGGGRFTLIGPLGEGGMAFVCSAWDERLQVFRAIKVLLPDFARRRSIRERFEAEARTMARLEHPNIVRVYDVGTELSLPYITMELVMGGSLDGWLRTHGAMPPRMAAEVVLQLCQGTQAAHALGVIHRDIKPHNLLVGRGDVCKLTDFGIAQLQASGTTRAGVAMGTLGYMAPEQQISAKDVDERADVYSIGATLWKLLTDGPVENLVVEVSRTRLAEVVEPLRPVVRRCLAYEREDRYPSITELLRDLQSARDALPPDPPDAPPLQLRDPSSVPPAAPEGCEPISAIFDATLTGDTWADQGRTSLPYRMSLPPPAAPSSDEMPDWIDRDALVDDRGGYVVELSDEDVEATLRARRNRRESESERRSLPQEPLRDRLAEEVPEESVPLAQTVAHAVFGALRVLVIPLILVAVVGFGLLAWAHHRAQEKEEQVLAARVRVRTVVSDDAAPAVKQVRRLGGDTRQLEVLYFELEEAEGEEQMALLEELIVSMEERLDELLPEDPSEMTPEQADAIERVMRLRKALNAYQRAIEAR